MDRIRTRIKTNYGNRFRDRQRKAEQEQDHKIFRHTKTGIQETGVTRIQDHRSATKAGRQLAPIRGDID
jgi:hypothetical protein